MGDFHQQNPLRTVVTGSSSVSSSTSSTVAQAASTSTGTKNVTLRKKQRHYQKPSLEKALKYKVRFDYPSFVPTIVSKIRYLWIRYERNFRQNGKKKKRNYCRCGERFLYSYSIGLRHICRYRHIDRVIYRYYNRLGKFIYLVHPLISFFDRYRILF